MSDREKRYRIKPISEVVEGEIIVGMHGSERDANDFRTKLISGYYSEDRRSWRPSYKRDVAWVTVNMADSWHIRNAPDAQIDAEIVEAWAKYMRTDRPVPAEIIVLDMHVHKDLVQLAWRRELARRSVRSAQIERNKVLVQIDDPEYA